MKVNNAFHGNTSLADIGADYPLEWLDQLVTDSLNPVNIKPGTFDPQLFNSIIEHLKEEDSKLQLLIKTQAFSLSEEEIGMLIQRYHSAFIKLMELTMEHRRAIGFEDPVLQLYDALIHCLDHLLGFIEMWFPKYLSLDERVPPSYLAVTKVELKRRIQKLTEKIDNNQYIRPVLKLVMKRLNQFVNNDSHKFEITFRAVLYKKELIGKLEELNYDLPTTEFYTALHEMLIYMNFNSKTYIKLLTTDILKLIDDSADELEKIDKLLFFFKAFSQIHSKPGAILNPKYHDIETILKNWYEHEIAYLEKRLQLPLPNQVDEPPNKSEECIQQKPINKVTCSLSTDQMGLIIRGADEARIIVAKSLNEVFRTLVPHLSSPYKEELSYDGMRSKSYVAEEKDKEIAIEFLEKIIKKIKGY